MARSTSCRATFCSLLSDACNFSAAFLAALAPQHSSTPNNFAATPGSAAREPSSQAQWILASVAAAAASADNIPSKASAAASSFEKTAVVCCRLASPTLSGCTIKDRRRKIRLSAAAPSLTSATVTPNTANELVARVTRHTSRPHSSEIAANSLAPALAAYRSSSAASQLPRATQPPSASARARSPLSASVCASPPATSR
mmetsp:Transcript_32434/g.89701  ORF Transcript_32434/g.89701 Transcript_32434/m.89701 type:complete len:200 (+) Transcript_32434:885-1484(+)